MLDLFRCWQVAGVVRMSGRPTAGPSPDDAFARWLLVPGVSRSDVTHRRPFEAQALPGFCRKQRGRRMLTADGVHVIIAQEQSDLAATGTDAFAAAPAHALDALDQAALDALGFGVINFDAAGIVRRYNAFESQAAGLAPARVLGHPLFTVVAPCMNNFLVAQRFEDAAARRESLDATIDYVLTLRMRPVKVRLRLLALPGASSRYVLVQRTV